MKRIFLVGLSSDYYLSIIEKLPKKSFRIDYWVFDDKSNENLLKKKFEKTFFIFFHDLIRGSMKLKIKKKPQKNLISRVKKVDLEILEEMFKRTNPKVNRSKKYLYNHFNEHLNKWLNFFQQKKIDIIIFHKTPHLPATYIMYLLCKKIFKIRVLILEDTKYLNYHFFINSIESLGKSFKIIRNSKSNKNASNYISLIRGNSKNKIKPNLNIYEKYNNSYYQVFVIFYNTYIRIFFNSNFNLFKIYGYFFTPSKRAIWNYTKFKFSNKKSFPTKFTDNFYYFYAFFKNNLIRKFYKKNCISKLPKKYIFFAPNYMPEKSTVPDGMKFFDAHKIIYYLNKYKTKETKIVYKEHPGQFNFHRFGFLSKDKTYYQKLLNNGVLLIDENTDTNTLIKKSDFLVTITSEIAMQAIIQKKAAMVFGNVWYQNCEGIIKIDNEKKIKKLIKKTPNTKINLSKVISFINSIHYNNTMCTGNSKINYLLKSYEELKQKKFLNIVNENYDKFKNFL